MIARFLLLLAVLAPLATRAQEAPAPGFDSGRLLATAGINTVEGSGGGGLGSWALITGYGTRDAIGGNAHATYVRVSDYALTSAGAAVGLYDRVELSYAHQSFDTGRIGGKLGLGRGYTFEQDVIGAKVRLFGNVVYDQDTWLPQVALGLQYKVNDRGRILRAVGASSAEGVDYTLAASKLFLAQSLLVNATLRMTKANETGLLGFGGDRHDGYTPQFEGSVVYLLTREIAIGAEYRTKPRRNLGFTKESDWKDVFIAWFPTKNLSLSLAYVDLGTIATRNSQRGVFASVALGF